LFVLVFFGLNTLVGYSFHIWTEQALTHIACWGKVYSE